MKIYLMQHGLANPATEDPKEGLSTDGMVQTKLAVEGLKTLNVSFDAICTSTKKRAQETASIVKQLKPNCPIIESKDLGAGSEVAVAIRFLGAQGQKDLFIVCHLPIIEKLLDFLLPDTAERPKVTNSGVIFLSVDQYVENAAKCIWQYDADQLGKMHGSS